MLTDYLRLSKPITLSFLFLLLFTMNSFGQKREWFRERKREYEKKECYKELEEREEEEEKNEYPLPGQNPEQIKQESMDLHFRLERYEAMKALNMTAAAGTSITMANGNLTGTWSERGPNNQPGRIRYADLWTATNNVYAVSDGGSVFRGTISGTGWTCLNDKLKCTSANYIRVIPNGTGKRIFVAGRNCIYSDDDGVTWSNSTGLSDMTPPATNAFPISTVILNDAANTIVMIAVHDWDVYVYRSSDKGNSFTKVKHYVGSGDYWNFVNTFNMWAPYKGTSPAYIIKSDSILKVTASSVTATKHNLAVSSRANITGAMIGSATYLYIYTNKQLYRSSDAGSSWTPQTSPIVCDHGGTGCYTPDPWGSYSFSCGLANQNQLYLGGLNLSASTNGGASWNQANYWQDYFGNGTTNPLHTLHTDIPAIVSVYNSSNQEIQFICCDQGLYISTDYCQTFTSLTMTGMNTNQGYWIYTRPDNPNYIYYGTQDGGYEIASQDAGGLLTFNETISGDYSHVVSTDGSTVWIVNPFEVFYSPAGNNGALTFPSLNFSGSGGMPFFSALLAHPTNTTQAYLGGGHLDGSKTGSYLHLLSYSNGSISYTTLPYDFSQVSGGTVYAIGISKTNTNYRYVHTSTGYFFYSTDGGNTWTANTTDILVRGNDVAKSNILISKNTPSTVYVCGDGYWNPGVYVSTNNGQSFSAMSNGLPNTYIHKLTFNEDESMIFAATEVGPYVYIVKDSLWYPMTGGTDQAYWDVEYLSASKTARFVTYGRGIWDFKIQSAPIVAITSPANNTNYNAPATIAITANASETGGSISKVEFYNSTTLLGTSTSSPYSYTWSNVATGTYNITAKAYDLSNVSTTSSNISVTVNSTALPSPWTQGDIGSTGLTGSGTYSSGTFTSKGSGADIWGTSDAFHFIYQPISGNTEIIAQVNSITNTDPWAKAGVMIRESLNANSAHAMVAVTPSNGVAFQNRTTTGGASNNTSASGTAPVWVKLNRTGNTFTTYQSANGTTWTSIGSITISMSTNVYVGLAVCAHNSSLLCTSTFSNVSVTTSTTPVVSITSPANNSVLTPGNITINATASETGGSISKVEFYNSATLLGTSTTSPYSYTWTSVGSGTYSLTAKAYDNVNASTVSSPVNITVNKAPTISITSPATGSVFQALSNITFTVNAADTDGSVSKVEYYKGSSLLGTSTTVPFTFNWNGVAAGTYSITAKAYDNLNVSTISSAISIKVNAAPSISITSPATGASFSPAPANITINTNASDTDGSISKVEFYSGGGLIGTITTSPFNYTWNSVAAGTYSLTAKATDNNGGITTSAAVSVTVSSGSNACSGIPQYSTTATYTDGSQVQNVGNYYQCKPWPYSGWCNNSAYAPGTTSYWQDAWTLLGSCTAKMGTFTESTQMDFYPNPAQTSLSINYASASAGKVSVVVSDMYSRNLIETEREVSSGSNLIEIDLEKLKNGIYMVTIINGNDKLIKQLVISK